MNQELLKILFLKSISKSFTLPRTRRKFDSVRNLLERARFKLSRSRAESTSSEEQRHLLSAENIGSGPGSPVHLPR